MITFSISTHNNLHYLKLAVSSVRACAHHKYAPFIIHAENCTDGTNEWLESNAEKYNIKFYIDENQSPRGIGGGMNFCAARVKTKYICFVHSDMVVSSNWDLRLVEYAEENPDTWVDSFRLEPDIWGSPPVRKATFLVERETFGELYSNFDNDHFQEQAALFTEANKDIRYPVVQGVSGLIEKRIWDSAGGNDPLFAPASWEDLDLFLRMHLAGIKFVSLGSSLVYHFGARGSHFPTDDFTIKSTRQQQSELQNIQKWMRKWGGPPIFNKFGMITGARKAPAGKTSR